MRIEAVLVNLCFIAAIIDKNIYNIAGKIYG